MNLFNLFRKKFFDPKQEAELVESIRQAEKDTSGEIKVHIEGKVAKDTFERALEVFSELEMQQTKDRNGVLFYLAVKDRKFAIVADAGINRVVPEGFWDQIKDTMKKAFAENKYLDGLNAGIREAGTKLKEFFPLQGGDRNELSDQISTGS